MHVMLFAFPYQLLLALSDKYMTIPMVIRFGSREKIWEERVKTAYIWGGIYMGIWLVFLLLLVRYVLDICRIFRWEQRFPECCICSAIF